MRRFQGSGAGRLSALAALLALALSGCSSIMPESAPQSSSDSSFRGRVANLFASPTAEAKPVVATAPDADDDCPSVDIRPGTSTLQLASGAETNATTLRYQATISQTARECAILGATMTIKVGVQGRVILGMAGAPGELEIPLRYALVQEGTQPKTIWTKLYKFPVAIPPGQTNVPFTHIEQDLTVPVPKRAELEAYVVYVGFDQVAAKEKPAKKPKTRASR